MKPYELRFKPLQNGAVLCCRRRFAIIRAGRLVSNPFRTGRYCAVVCTTTGTGTVVLFQTPSERGGIVLEKKEI